MQESGIDTLKRVVELQHGGTSAFVQSVRVHKAPANAETWDGVVHIFDLKGNAKAARAYAWSSPVRGGSRPRYFAVLHQGLVRGPLDAVRAAASLIQKSA